MPNGSQNPQSLHTYGLPVTRQTVAGTSVVLSASPCLFNYAECVGNASVAGWLLVYDATTAPADGTVTPMLAAYVAANGFVQINPRYPVPCVNGCVIVFSTTGVFTQTTSADNAGFLAGQAAGMV